MTIYECVWRSSGARWSQPSAVTVVNTSAITRGQEDQHTIHESPSLAPITPSRTSWQRRQGPTRQTQSSCKKTYRYIDGREFDELIRKKIKRRRRHQTSTSSVTFSQAAKTLTRGGGPAAAGHSIIQHLACFHLHQTYPETGWCEVCWTFPPIPPEELYLILKKIHRLHDTFKTL